MVTTEGPLLPLAAGALRVEKSRSFKKFELVSTAVSGRDRDKVPVPDFGPGTLSLRMILRAATTADHEMVDAAFGRYNLASIPSYGQFLSAHARVLGPLESAVEGLWDASIARLPLLEADLAELGTVVPSDAAFGPMSDARRWGMLYVLEGSRLGGGILAGRVAAGLPVRYLLARHEDGSWRRFGDALELAGASQGAAWHEDVVSGARMAFARFAESAGLDS
ncbi:MAG: hypothetical protein JWL66_796 [Sphingomonadales bacterium]|nr:hypothetical protein [Sphingomonadales bacterium]